MLRCYRASGVGFKEERPGTDDEPFHLPGERDPMLESVIRVMCPNLRCRAILAVPSEARGRLVRCRNCGSNIKIPEKKEAAPSPPADATPPAPEKKK